ncbi:MAG: PqqD family protein [Candidatus Delongbacteria bacterium]|jgi:hypothetical protein
MSEMNAEEYFPILVKSNIEINSILEDKQVIRPRFGRDMFLNKTSEFIFSILDEEKNLSLKEIVQLVMIQFEIEDEGRVTDDVMQFLNTMWKKTLIVWKGNINPYYFESLSSTKDGMIIAPLGFEAIRIVSDNNKEGIQFINPYNVSMFDDIGSVITVFSSGALRIMGTIEDNVIKEIIYFDNRSKIISLIYSNDAASGERIKKIIEKIIEDSGCGLLYKLEGEDEFAPSNIGFDKCGTLKKEIGNKNVEVYLTVV